MSSSHDPRTSRTLGALLGVHCGDSLGATLEFKPWTDINRQYPNGLREIIGGGPFSWDAGAATDDTDLTRAVLLAYRDYEESKQPGSAKSGEKFNVAKAAADYSVKWYNGEWPGRKKGDSPMDIGIATSEGLHEYKRTKDTTRSGAGAGSAGNGSLMRCIPTGLFGSPEDRRKESVGISEFTHSDRRCTVSCAAYNEIVAALIDGKTPQEAVDIGRKVAEDMKSPDTVEAIEEGERLNLSEVASEGPRKYNEKPSRSKFQKVNPSGFVLGSLKLAIAAVLDPRSFEDIIVDVVRLGGDTDTNGAIAGGLVGARDGIEKIPTRWVETLQFGKEFEEVALRILEMQKVKNQV